MKWYQVWSELSFNDLIWDHIQRLHKTSLFLVRFDKTFLPQSISFRHDSLHSLPSVVLPPGPNKIFHQCPSLLVQRILWLPSFQEQSDLVTCYEFYKVTD